MNLWTDLLGVLDVVLELDRQLLDHVPRRRISVPNPDGEQEGIGGAESVSAAPAVDRDSDGGGRRCCRAAGSPRHARIWHRAAGVEQVEAGSRSSAGASRPPGASSGSPPPSGCPIQISRNLLLLSTVLTKTIGCCPTMSKLTRRSASAARSGDPNQTRDLVLEDALLTNWANRPEPSRRIARDQGANRRPLSGGAGPARGRASAARRGPRAGSRPRSPPPLAAA